MNRSGLVGYLPWQLRDASVKSALPVLLFALLAVAPLLTFKSQRPDLDYRTSAQAIEVALQIYGSMTVLTMWLGAVMVMTQVIALDRDRQFYRFLFLTPVTPWQFYLQRMLVGLATLVGFYALIPLGYRAFVTDVPVMKTVLAVTLMGVLVGGLATFVSALTRRDALATVLTYIISGGLQDADRAGMLTSWLQPLAAVLPPISDLAMARASLLTGVMPETQVLAHILLYGVALAAAGLFLVKKLPIAR